MSKVDNGIRVLKFGGTSVKDPQRLSHAAKIVAAVAETAKVIVVVSAMGHTTDSLVRLASRCSSKPNPRELDVLLASGEQQSIALLSIVLSDLGVKVKSFTGAQLGIVTQANYGNADIVSIDSVKIKDAFIDHDVIVVAGFQGVTSNGDITTLGRGGSDTSAVALAAAARASSCEIYTDVDGIFTADPNIIGGAIQHRSISYECCLEMAANGAQVIHPRAVECARENSIAVRVRSVFNPSNVGTLIEDDHARNEHGITGIASSNGFSLLNVRASQNIILAKTLDSLVSSAVGSVNLIEKLPPDSGTAAVSYVISGLNPAAGEKLVAALGQLSGVEEASLNFDITRISIVGKGARQLERSEYPFDMLKGTIACEKLLLVGKELSISIFVDTDRARPIWNLLHESLKPRFTATASPPPPPAESDRYEQRAPSAICA